MGSTIKRVLPRWLVRWIRRCRDLPCRFQEWPAQRRAVGWKNAWQLGWSAFRYPVGDPHDPPGPLRAMKIPGLQHPFWFREGTSDVPVIRQIFVRREYQWLERLPDINTIVDLGANIGGAAVSFLNLFPAAEVIAVEPAPGNYQVLKRNLAPYGKRGKSFQAGIWPEALPLQLARNRFRDRLDWSIQVERAGPQATDTVRGMTVQELLSESRLEKIDLLKVDIEGAERELFAGDTSWLQRVRYLCIEIHDDDCRQAVMEAFKPYRYQMETRGETTLFAIN